MTMNRSQRRSASGGIGLYRLTRTQTTESLSLMLRAQPTPTSTEPFSKVEYQYMDTLCITQKQTNLTNSLLQDIAVFNEHDSTKLKEWLMNIETTTDLTNES